MLLTVQRTYGKTRGVRQLDKPADFGSPSANQIAHLANLLLHASRIIQAHLAGERYFVELTRRFDSITYPLSGGSRATGAKASIVCINKAVALALRHDLLILGRPYVTNVTQTEVTQDVNVDKTITAYELTLTFAPVAPTI